MSSSDSFDESSVESTPAWYRSKTCFKFVERPCPVSETMKRTRCPTRSLILISSVTSPPSGVAATALRSRCISERCSIFASTTALNRSASATTSLISTPCLAALASATHFSPRAARSVRSSCRLISAPCSKRITSDVSTMRRVISSSWPVIVCMRPRACVRLSRSLGDSEKERSISSSIAMSLDDCMMCSGVLIRCSVRDMN
mmetsp:Transcript_17808/g.37865  ORF Transcript_17808/g.37865 Transcript_17808/m.37865 type:complete len:202 (-) Transcript_17808:618-1223(-)